MQTVIGPVYGDERLAEITQGRFSGVPGVLFSDHDPYPLSVLEHPDGYWNAFSLIVRQRRLGGGVQLRLCIHESPGASPPDPRRSGTPAPAQLADRAAVGSPWPVWGDIAEADTLQKRAPPPRGLTRAGDRSVLSVDRCADLPQGVLSDGAGRGAAVEEDSSEIAAVAHQLGAVFANRT